MGQSWGRREGERDETDKGETVLEKKRGMIQRESLEKVLEREL